MRWSMEGSGTSPAASRSTSASVATARHPRGPPRLDFLYGTRQTFGLSGGARCRSSVVPLSRRRPSRCREGTFVSSRRGTLRRGTLRGRSPAQRPPALCPGKAIVAMSPCKLEESDVAREVARKLAPEFVGFFSLETIERNPAEGYAYYSAMVESGEAMANYLPILTARFVRNRLHFVRTDRLVFAHAPLVLFVCVRNARW